MTTHHLPEPVARLFATIALIENALLIVLLTAMVVLAGGQILLRNLFDLNFLGIDQLLRLLVLWVALFGAIAASRVDKHINVDVLSRLLAPRRRAGVQALTSLFTAFVVGVLAWQAVRFVMSEFEVQQTVFASVPIWVAEMILPVAFVLIAVRYLLLGYHRARQSLGREPIS